MAWQKDRLLLGILLLVPIFTYWHLFSVPFIYDDIDFLFSWPQVQSWQNLPELLAGDTPIGHEGVYRPLRSIFYVIAIHLFQGNLFWYHIQTLSILLACVLLIYGITKQLTNNKRLSFITALFFGVVTPHVDNVANLTGSFDTIGFLFFFAAIFLFLSFLTHKKTRTLIASVTCATIAYFTYELTLVLPFILLLCVRYRNKSFSYRLLLPYVIGAFGYVSIRFLLQIPNRGDISTDLLSKILLLPQGMLSYLMTSLVPIAPTQPTLAQFQGTLLFSTARPPLSTQQALLSVGTAVSIGVFLVLLCLTAYWIKKRRWIGFGFGLFFLCLLPIVLIGIQSSERYGIQLFSSRYGFVASYGICLLLGLGMEYLIQKTTHSAFQQYLRILGLCIIGCLFLLHLITTPATLLSWRDPRPALYQQVTNEKESAAKYNDLGVLLASQKQYEKAVDSFQKSLQIEPDYNRAQQNLTKLCYELTKRHSPEASTCRK